VWISAHDLPLRGDQPQERVRTGGTARTERFRARTPAEGWTGKGERKMPKSLKCTDVGRQCSWEGHAETEEELMAKLKDHASKVHNMKEIPPDLMKKVKAAIKDE